MGGARAVEIGKSGGRRLKACDPAVKVATSDDAWIGPQDGSRRTNNEAGGTWIGTWFCWRECRSRSPSLLRLRAIHEPDPIADDRALVIEPLDTVWRRAASAMAERTRSPILSLSGLGLVLAVSGCGLAESPVLAPKGPITLTMRDLLFDAFGLMLIVVIPVFLMAAVFVWFYRPASKHDVYQPDWGYSVWMDALVWLVPAAIVIAVGSMVWESTHKLDPYRPLDSAQQPLEVQAVAQDWKWLFLYPEQDIAVVNELVFPSGRPLSLKITSDTVMNSFLIPALGGQIYAMAGMETQLHLLADQPGEFQGRNTQFSGSGFANQHFEARATSDQDFEAWVAKARQSGVKLDAAAYQQLAKPSQLHPVTYYAGFEPDLFARIIAKYAPAGPGALHSKHAQAESP
jgi:cytochrome o ubiquinol oxidase subunit 2